MTINRLLARVAYIAICVLLTQFAFSQNKVVTGKVTDDKGNPLAGVSVSVKGSKSGTTSDANGLFSLPVKSTAKTLVLSSVGFSDQEFDVTTTNSVTASMVPASTSLGDVVVT